MDKRDPPQAPPPPYAGPTMNYGPAYCPAGPQPGIAPAPSQGYGYQGAACTPAPPVVTYVVPRPLQDVPGQMMCPYCQQLVVTITEHEPGLLTWAICGGLAAFGFCLCCFFPFLMDSTKDVNHHCPMCRKVIYVYKRLN